MKNHHHAKGPRQHSNCTSLSIWRNQQAGANDLIFQDPGADIFTVTRYLLIMYMRVRQRNHYQPTIPISLTP